MAPLMRFVPEIRKHLSRKALLFEVFFFFFFKLDNALGHREFCEINNKVIKVVYLPPKQSLILPLDQGIIRTFKVHYTWYFMGKTVNIMEENTDRVYKYV